MAWVKLSKGHTCARCGIAIQHWVLLKREGDRVVEATFCSVCNPEVEKVLVMPDKASDAT